MSTSLKIDQEVYVPRSSVGLDPSTPVGPFLRARIRAINKLSVTVQMPHDPLVSSKPVSKSKVHPRFGTLIVRIGDFKEAELIEPLSKSVLHFCRMLLPGDSVQVIEVRTVGELKHFWNSIHDGFEQVILIGHGDGDKLYFGAKAISAKALSLLFERPKPSPKEFISLCCKSGQKAFAKEFSLSSSCSAFVAPYHSIHGVTASQFCQAYMTKRLLEGHTIPLAFKQARKILIGTASFRLWQNGNLKAGPI